MVAFRSPENLGDSGGCDPCWMVAGAGDDDWFGLVVLNDFWGVRSRCP